MLTCVPFAWVWMTPSQFQDFSEAIVAVTLFSSNVLFWLQTDYFAPLAELNPPLHTWSLAVEEPFYLVFPFLMIFLWRFGRVRVLGVIVPTIQNVVVAYRIHSAIGGDRAGLYPDLPDTVSDARAQQILKRFTAAPEAFVAAGKTVVLLEQVPEIPKDMEGLVYRAGSLDAPIPGVARDWWTRRREKFEREFQLPAAVRVVNADDVFCDEVSCRAGKDGVSYYFDDDHLSVAGATLVAKKVLDALSPKTAAR